jgi:lysophospholipase L1-like esterase
METLCPWRQHNFLSWTNSSVSACLCLATLAAAVFLASTAAIAQTNFPTFGQVDYYWTQNPQLFRSLWQAAHNQTVRIAILGDSQETNPGGRGLDYIPRLNYEMWKRFGNVPETPIEGCSFYGSGAPFADWMLSGSCASPGPSATRLAANQILPGLQPRAFSTLNGASNANGEYFGQLTLLQQDASGIDPAAAIPSNIGYFNTSGVVKAQIFAATNPSSGEIGYWAQPTNSQLPSYYSPTTTAGTVTLGLQSSTFAVKSGKTAPLQYNGSHYMALQVAGTNDNTFTDIIGLRFFNETHPQGVIFDTFSAGGYQAANFLTNHGNAGAIFGALNFQAAILHYGANDGGAGVSAQQFEANLKGVMALVRTWTGSPSFPIILIADVYRTGLTVAQQAQFDMYVGAQLAIAQADSNGLVINSRRLMDDLGWSANSGMSSTFLVDGVHYTPGGAQRLAASEVAAMMGEILVAGCAIEQSSVTLQPSETLTFDIGGATPCSGYGQYATGQTLILNRATLNVQLTNGFTPVLGQSFHILSARKVSGAFGTLTLPALPPGLTWDVSGLYTSGTITVAAVSSGSAADGPLPPWALGALGILLVGIASRRMKKAA